MNFNSVLGALPHFLRFVGALPQMYIIASSLKIPLLPLCVC